MFTLALTNNEWTVVRREPTVSALRGSTKSFLAFWKDEAAAMAHAAVSDVSADVDSLVRPVRRADPRGKEKQTGVALNERPARTKRARPITRRLAPRARERKKKN